MKTPRPIEKLINHFERLPGIGPKTAQRLVFYLLHFPQEEIERFSEALIKFKTDIQICSTCKNVGEIDPCEICTDTSRNRSLIAVVANPLDVFALERAGYKGNYHVLHGLIDPLNNIGPEELFIKDLVERLKNIGTVEEQFAQIQNNTDYSELFDKDLDAFLDSHIKESPKKQQENDHIELIMATNISMEGESTAMYITKLIRENGLGEDKVKITRIARGLPVGGDIEYADDVTLLKALEGRSKF